MLLRKLIINLIVFIVCGTIALTIPVLVNHFKQKAVAASSSPSNPNTYKLTSCFVGDQNLFDDTRVAWQISLTDKTRLIADWTAIYQDACCNHNLIYDVENLVLTAQGLVYRGVLNQADYESLYAQRYTSTVTYKGYTCEICLP